MSKDNNQLIANRIYEIEHASYTQRKEWRLQNIKSHKLTEDIYMEKSEDHMCWYLWKYCENKGDWSYFKCIPAFEYEVRTIENLLKEQRWIYI